MDTIIWILKLVVALSLINVWIIQPTKNTRWRGGNATTIIEEFKVYGLPVWFCYLIGFLKVGLAIILIFSIFYPSLEMFASIGLAFLLSGSIIMHIKIKDPLYKSLPAFTFLVACLLIAFIYSYKNLR